MLALISSIPTNVREEFDVQDLPSRSVNLSAEQMNQVFGGCVREGYRCYRDSDCCCNERTVFNCRYVGSSRVKYCRCAP